MDPFNEQQSGRRTNKAPKANELAFGAFSYSSRPSVFRLGSDDYVVFARTERDESVRR